ncbi:flagellar protein FliO/FliZ [Halopseudomonas xinjiangensis]|uniref:Flagellar protein n=1 Tax=Halopseudomonas xinjiangensis TaxID=487184 RepID=A0A1H1MSE7_9GAMM|nr:flagellar biosynthetic protein FliO [Halopseudomonas xinjiangensis]SDR89552.1 flagellar protein FliO/FliZ [Halopseudomonas xinjiangensis]
MKSVAVPFVFVGWVASAAVWAAPVATSEAQTSVAGQVGQLVLGLAFIVGLIFLLGYLMRRIGPLAAQGGQNIRIISSLPLGPRDRLMLVDVAGKQLLLGASPGRISTLHVFDEPIAELPSEGTPGGDFAQKLQALLKRENRP